MVETPGTRARPLIRLRDSRKERAWEEFVDIYEPPAPVARQTVVAGCSE
jgi:hypothetical protein